MAETKHTPGRISHGQNGIIYDGNGNRILVVVSDPDAPESKANIERIVLCCNSHDALVEALEDLTSAVADTDEMEEDEYNAAMDKAYAVLAAATK